MYYWRTHVAIVGAVAVAGSALTGALIVGDSMRASLRAVALSRLGDVDYTLSAPRFFRQAVADELNGSPSFADDFGTAAAAIYLTGGVTNADTGARAGAANVWAVDSRFWSLADSAVTVDPLLDVGRDVIINEPLAREIGVAPGEDVLIRVGRVAEISPDSLFGSRSNNVLSLRATVKAIVAAEGMGRFGLRHNQLEPRNVYVPLPVVQRWLDQREMINTLLVGHSADGSREDELQERLDSTWQLSDLGLRLRGAPQRGFMTLESSTFLLPPAVEDAARGVAKELGLTTGSILSYLANEISVLDPVEGRATSAIPYSVVTALDDAAGAISHIERPDGSEIDSPAAGEIFLNSWAADELNVSEGRRIRLSYYVTGPFGQLQTHHADFDLKGIVKLEGGAKDPGFTPEYPGVTDTENMADWDPPFPVDLNRIRDIDEQYWQRYRTTPKAFIALSDGLRLWADQQEYLGRLTSMRFASPDNQAIADVEGHFKRALLARLGGASLGLRIFSPRSRALQASAGSTDFGGLFIGFSFFLIFSAGMLVSLMFRLAVERRAAQHGILLAVGFSAGQVNKIVMTEGAVLAMIGAVVGLGGSVAYAALMLTGLRTWWSSAVSAPFLGLHVVPVSLIIGALMTVVVALISIWAAVRGLFRMAPSRLLAGAAALSDLTRKGNRRIGLWLSATCGVIAILIAALPMWDDAIPEEIAFFTSGAILLLAVLIFVRDRLRRPVHHARLPRGKLAIVRLGLRNAPRHPGRSTQTVGLIASAVFIVIAVQAFRIEVQVQDLGRDSPAGGFDLVAESSVPIMFDLNTRTGRNAAGFSESAQDSMQDVTVMPFRLRRGDESSCLNLYQPTRHRIVGATDGMIDRGGFEFGSVLDVSNNREDNPWRLLLSTLDDGAIPAIGDYNAVKWQLHSGLGGDLTITDEQGQARTLRFVALLDGSILQDEIIISEAAFKQLFPGTSGYAFYLISAPRDRVSEVSTVLERELAPFSFDAHSAYDRLERYAAIQNTYLRVFQALGGFGLVLGTLGLAAVLLRNVWERRGELALLRALGFENASLGSMILAENGLLVVVGLASGLIPALIAIGPHIARRPQTVPWLSLGLILAAVFAVGMISALLAVAPTLRANLIPALRRE